MSDTVAVGNDEAGAVISFRLDKSLYRLVVVRAQGYPGNVDVAVGHRHHTQVLLGQRLTGSRELGYSTSRSCLGHLPAGVGVHTGIHNQDVHVTAGSKDVVQTAVPDVISPAITTEDPDRAINQVVDHTEQLLSLRFLDDGQFGLQFNNTRTLCRNAFLRFLVGGQECAGQLGSDIVFQSFDELAGKLRVLVYGKPEAQTKLGVILEQAVGPGGTSSVDILRIRGRWQVTTVDGGTACCVGDDRPVPEQLGEQFHVSRFAAAGASTGVLE